MGAVCCKSCSNPIKNYKVTGETAANHAQNNATPFASTSSSTSDVSTIQNAVEAQSKFIT